MTLCRRHGRTLCGLALLTSSGCSFVLGFPDIEERDPADAATPSDGTSEDDGTSSGTSASTNSTDDSDGSSDSQSSDSSSDPSGTSALEDGGTLSMGDSGTAVLEDGGSAPGDGGTSPSDGGSEPFVDSGAQADAGVMCAAPCNDGTACETPLALTLLDTATPTDMGIPPDGVLPVGLAAVEDRVFASVRFKPFITNGPDLTVPFAGSAIYELSETAPAFLVKTYECHLPNGTAFDGSIAATTEHVYNLLTSPAASESGATQLASSTQAIGSGCEAGASTEITENDVNNNLVPFIFRFGNEEPLATFDALTNLQQGSAVLLDLATNPAGDTLAVVGVTPFAVFGSTPPPQNLNYFTLRLDTSVDPMTPAWVRFSSSPPAEIGGTFPSSVTIEAGIAVDDAGDTWATGTVNASGANRMFVEHRSADGLRLDSWLAPQASFGKSIAVANGHVVVGGNFEDSFEVPSGTLNATGRDFVVLHFDAADFPGGNPQPTWSYPEAGMTAAQDFSLDDSLAKVAFGELESCEPALYVLSCSGPNCSINEDLLATLQRLNVTNGALLSTRRIEPSAGSFAATELVVQPSGVWFGGELRGTLYSRSSSNFVTTSTPAGAGLFGKLPL